MTSLHHIAQALDSTAVRKTPAEPMGAAKIIQFHRRTNITLCIHFEVTDSGLSTNANEYLTLLTSLTVHTIDQVLRSKA